MSDAVDATLTFEQQRRTLEGFAYRMTGSLADAHDIVQDTYVKWQQVAPGTVANPRAWLTTVCTNLALNRLQSARYRREQYVGVWLPEPWIDDHGRDPSQQTEVEETISIAFMLALERLTPPERAALLLREAFDYRFAEISTILGRSEAACRQLATRARARLRESRPRFRASAGEHRRLLEAFLQAARGGDMATLQELLTADSELHADAGGKATTAPHVLCGPTAIAAFLVNVWSQPETIAAQADLSTYLINGAPALLMRDQERLVAALSLACDGHKIDRIFAHRNPDKLDMIAHALTNDSPKTYFRSDQNETESIHTKRR